MCGTDTSWGAAYRLPEEVGSRVREQHENTVLTCAQGLPASRRVQVLYQTSQSTWLAKRPCAHHANSVSLYNSPGRRLRRNYALHGK